jgi:hypothetical protein
VRVTVRMRDREGEFARLIAVLAEHRWGVMGVGTFPSRRHPGFYDTVLKIPHVEVDDVRAVLMQIADQELVDVRTAV